MRTTARITKRIGETPLQALERARKRYRIPSDVPMAYAGRLDPMASGTLLILIGEECKRQKDYHAFQKEYEVEVLLGVGSDTGDILGLVKRGADITLPAPRMIRDMLTTFVGPYHAPYPLFSSKTVNGKPLFLWALEGRIGEIEIPHQDAEIFALRYRGMRRISSEALLHRVRKNIGRLAPVTEPSKRLGEDFRKEVILASWESLSGVDARTHFPVLRIRVRTSGGTYMRTLAEDIGRILDTHALALSIRRTRIFTY